MPYDDFSFFAQAVPGFYFNVGIASPDTAPGKAAPNRMSTMG
jgi:hypothetical protein